MLYKLSLIGAFGTAQASYSAIYGYQPNSQVTDHNAVDRDQGALEEQLGLTAGPDYTNAKAIYTSGGNSKAYFQIARPAGVALDYGTGKDCQFTIGANVVTGKLKQATTYASDAAIQCLYPTGDNQATYQECQVGALVVGATSYPPVTTGCVDASADIILTDGSNTETITGGTYGTPTNKAGRTLQGFAKYGTTTGKMYTNSASCPGCPYATYTKFYNYFGTHTFMDKFVTAALDGVDVATVAGKDEVGAAGYPATTFSRSYALELDFSLAGLSAGDAAVNDKYRIDGSKKGTVFHNVWMYTIREFEDAIDDCNMGSLDNNYGSVHAWDEGVAFYTGSLEGTDGSGSGKLLAALADKRCPQFDTCGSDSSSNTGTSYVNLALLEQFQIGRNDLMINACQQVRPIVERVTSLMTVPMIQGTLRYAYKMGTVGLGSANPTSATSIAKSNAEGTTFLFAILPLIHACDASAAKTLYDNMKLGASVTNMVAVKAAIESVYSCLGVTCKEVGALNVAGGCATGDVGGWCSPCQDASTQTTASPVAYAPIAGYVPRSKVTDHNALDMDQKAMETLLTATVPDFVNARKIYKEGGNSKAYASITISGSDVGGTATPAFTAGTVVSAIANNGASITGAIKSDTAAGATSIDVLYGTNEVQANYNGGCQVGGLVSTTEHGCVKIGSTVVIGWTAVNASDVTNKAGRTLAGFGTATTTTGKMYTNSASCTGCPYVTYSAFYDYYGDHSYMDDYVTAALDGTAYASTSGKAADFSSANGLTGAPADAYRIEGAKKGSAYMNVWMYTIREFEDAIDDCTASSIDRNYDAAHAWDEGVAFYTGSLEGTDGTGSGAMVYNLADKRCQNFATCGTNADSETGTSHVNIELFQLFAQGEAALYQGNCNIRPIVTRVISLMAVPLIQGTLRYAYKMGKYGPGGAASASDSSNAKSNAEGATFAFAVLPLIAKCDATAAATVYDNMKLGAVATTDMVAVKAALESVYPCLGITCKEVGALTVGGGLASGDAWGTVCTDPVPPSPAATQKEVMPAGALAGIIIAAVLAVVFFVFICCMYRAEKKGTPIFTSLEGGKSKVSASSNAA